MRTDSINLHDVLSEALEHIKGHKDKKEIITSLVPAVLAQETTSMRVTKLSMVAGDLQSVCPTTLIADWQMLARHYPSSQYQKVFNRGIEVLARLTPEEAQNVVYEIRCALEPIVNHAMEQETIRVGFNIPIIGPILIPGLQFSFRGPRFAMRKLRGRLVRLFVQSMLWVSVVVGAFHWISWTIFDAQHLMEHIEGWAHLAQFLLLVSTTLIVWVVFRKNTRRIPESRESNPFKISRLLMWLIVIVGWCYWVAWIIFGVPSKIPGMDEAGKLTLPFLLIIGSVGAWISGRIFEENNAEE